MKELSEKLTVIVLIPLVMNLFFAIYYRGKFEEMASEYDKGAIYEQKANEIEAGEVVPTPQEMTEHYTVLADTESGIASSFRLMGASILFWIFGLIVIAGVQTVLLFGIYRARKDT